MFLYRHVCLHEKFNLTVANPILLYWTPCRHEITKFRRNLEMIPCMTGEEECMERQLLESENDDSNIHGRKFSADLLSTGIDDVVQHLWLPPISVSYRYADQSLCRLDDHGIIIYITFIRNIPDIHM